jgi:hypothetical protein
MIWCSHNGDYEEFYLYVVRWKPTDVWGEKVVSIFNLKKWAKHETSMKQAAD